jgi:hypothetical protein
MVPTLSHINPARNSSTRLFTAGLILAIFRFIIHSFAMGISDHQHNWGMRKAPGRGWGHALLVIADL